MAVSFRKNIEEMAGYVPGEQPQTDEWCKLNTNENPYPPSQKVVDAIQTAATSGLNVYPDPLATEFREVAADLFDVTPDWILPANGSDEILTVLVRSFCSENATIVYPYPSYVLYETLAHIQGCQIRRLPLNKDFEWDQLQASQICSDAQIVFVPNPNSPSGNRWSADQLAQLMPDNGLLVLDEAYGDFTDPPHEGELLRDPRFAGRMVVTRTLSKSYSLAGLRFGYCVADPSLVAGMRKVKDSYNCDTISICAATAALKDQKWMKDNRDRIIATRNRLAGELPHMGFRVFPSEANFLWTVHSSGQHDRIYRELKDRQILIRNMKFNAEPGLSCEGLRITIGTDGQVDSLLNALREITTAL